MKFLSDIVRRARAASGAVPIAGLEIGDRAIRFAILGADLSVARQAVSSLAPGAVKDGKILDSAAFKSALCGLRAREALGKGDIPVVLSVSPALVYAQAFSLPYLAGPALEEAALLNLRVISPVDFESAYADWQAIEEDEGGRDRSEVRALGAFAERAAIDAYYAALASCGFVPVAIEFASLSLARAVAEGLDPALRPSPAIGISMASDGILFFIMEGGVPYFTRFMPWDAVQGEGAAGAGALGVTVERLKAVAGTELRRLLDFYRSKWKGSIGRVFVMNAASNADIASWIKEEFALEVFAVGGYQGTDRAYLASCGAALRGMVPRGKDRMISLARAGTEEGYFRSRVTGFARGARRAAWAALAGIAVAFLALDMIAADVEAGTLRRAEGGGGAASAALTGLEAEAQSFNALVAKVGAASSAGRPIGRGIGAIVAAAGDGVRLAAVTAAAAGKTAAVSGEADSEQGAVAFKGRVADNPLVERIDMPLSAIVSAPGKKASFSATVTFK